MKEAPPAPTKSGRLRAVRARLRLRPSYAAESAEKTPLSASVAEFRRKPEASLSSPRALLQQRRIHRQINRRMALIVLGTIAFYVLWLICLPVGVGSPRRRRSIRRAILKRWGRTMLRVVHADVTIEGTPPEPPFFLVANHMSYIDIFLLSAQTGCVFVARSDMAHWPVLGFMMRTAQQLFIERQQLRDARRVIGLITQVLDEQDGVVVFAEAKCGRGDVVLPFKPSLFEPVALRNFPVHCASIHYETEATESPAGDSVVWWRWEPIGDHLQRLLALPRFKATVRFVNAPVKGGDRKVLASESHAAISTIFRPVAQGRLEELPPPEWLPKYLR